MPAHQKTHARQKRHTQQKTPGGNRAKPAKVALALTAAAVLAIAALFFWLNVLRDAAPDRFTLTAVDAAATGDPVGTWHIAPGSVAGYRVVEDIAGGLQNFEAVGRTSQIEGSIVITGTAEAAVVDAADFTVDVASMESGSGNRDTQFRGRIMETDQFPTASFSLTEPIDVGKAAELSGASQWSTVGALTLHGVTRSVPVTIEAQLIGTRLEVVGSVPVVFTDYDIPDPSVERIVSVRSEGLIEFQLILDRPG